MFHGIQIEIHRNIKKSDGVRSSLGNLSLYLTAMTQPLSFKIVLYNNYKVNILVFGVTPKYQPSCISYMKYVVNIFFYIDSFLLKRV